MASMRAASMKPGPRRSYFGIGNCRAPRRNGQAFDSKDHFAPHVISVMAWAVPQDDLPAVATDELFDRAVSRCPRSAQGESMQASHPPARTA